jgi:hypothetical protein
MMLDEIIKIVAAVLSGLVIIALYSIPFYYLWNWLMVKFFYFDYIDSAEALGFVSLLMLIRFIAFDINTPK